MQQHILVAGATFAGQGPATTCTLTKAAQAAVVPGKSVPPAAIVAYFAANQPAGQVQAGGYVKGTPAYYQYLAWHQAACGGYIHTSQAQAAGRPPYRNYQTGPALQQGSTLGRLAQHAQWQLRVALQNQAQQAAKQAAQAAGTAVA